MHDQYRMMEKFLSIKNLEQASKQMMNDEQSLQPLHHQPSALHLLIHHSPLTIHHATAIQISMRHIYQGFSDYALFVSSK